MGRFAARKGENIMKPLVFAAAFGLGACLVAEDASAQGRGGAQLDLSGPVADGVVVVCESDCGNSEVAVSIPTERWAFIEQSWNRMGRQLHWIPRPSDASLSRIGPGSSCQQVVQAMIKLNQDLVPANRTMRRIHKTGYFVAVDNGRLTRVARGDAQFERTLDRWIEGRLEVNAAARRVLDEWNRRGCA